MFFVLLFLSLLNLNGNYLTFIVDVKSQSYFNAQNFSIATSNIINLLNLDLNQISADAYLVQEIDGKTLLSKNALKQKDIASLTKLMSAYIGYLIYPNNEIFVFSENAINQEGDVGYFRVGEKIDRDSILKAGLISSSNDAIYLFAEKYGLENFVNLMNQSAKSFGMFNTYFTDPTGLKDNLSTPYDLYLLSRKIFYQTPEIFYLTTNEKVVINNKIFWTTNYLLPYYKNIIVGGKTGYKPFSGENLILILKFPKSPFISLILLDSKDRFKDAKLIIQALEKYYK